MQSAHTTTNHGHQGRPGNLISQRTLPSLGHRISREFGVDPVLHQWCLERTCPGRQLGIDFSVGEWTNDWVVNGPTDIWLYANDRGCAHFTGSSVIGRRHPHKPASPVPPQAPRGIEINESTGLAYGQHVVASCNRLDLLRQPDQQTPATISRRFGTFGVPNLVTEPGSNTVWAMTATDTDYRLVRYVGDRACASPGSASRKVVGRCYPIRTMMFPRVSWPNRAKAVSISLRSYSRSMMTRKRPSLTRSASR